jgi:sortase (surface protein transpeptidase)
MSKKKKILDKISEVYIWIGGILLLIATAFVLSPLYPYVWFKLNNQSLEKEQNNVESISKEIVQKVPFTPVDVEDNDLGLPPIDESLTEENTLLIPSIGVAGIIFENVDPDKGLENGIWRATDWGTPIENDFPIILAAHRFGYLSWTKEFRKLNSFQDLPRTGVGDEIEIIWGQRVFKYEIYKAEDSTGISDYSADLILYTCKTMNSSMRVFRYANRID